MDIILQDFEGSEADDDVDEVKDKKHPGFNIRFVTKNTKQTKYSKPARYAAKLRANHFEIYKHAKSACFKTDWSELN